ncbi:putative quinol monooxygenase [Caldimonas brevitalea]|uniref:putative quinol monooxygenase n=1 Tax=Caldimonas brevitalea TaxID=413882 RepID=UPI0009FB6E9B|nr:putative quinol monooxygenase [Caldimonas brevitalea]
MIVLMGHAHLDPSDVNEFVADVQAIIPSTRAAEGCLFYAVALDDASAGRTLIVERWQDQESLTAHLDSPRVSNLLQKWMNRVRVDVSKFDASNERTLLDL